MNSTTITADKNEARRQLDIMRRLRRSMGEKFSDNDQLLLAAYREIAKRRRLIDVNAAIAEGGLNRAGFPRLAIARANRNRVFWQATSVFSHLTGKPEWNGGGHYNYAISKFRITTDEHAWPMPSGTFPAVDISNSQHVPGKGNLVASVPYIPAYMRPSRGLGSLYILFECNWYWTKEKPRSSPDPFLLKQISGPLMSIVAEWALTGLEQKIFDAAIQ